MTQTAEIERLLRAGQPMRMRLFDVKRLDSAAGHLRVAIVVPKFQYSVVRRNRLKRQVRELTRLHVLPQPCACDLILRARRAAYEAPFDSLRDDIHAIAAQLT